MRRIDRQWGEHWTDLCTIEILQPDCILLAHLVHRQEPDAIRVQSRTQFIPPTTVLIIHHPANSPVDRSECLCRRKPVNTALHHFTFHLLLDASHPDLEKLVQVGAGDAEEFNALKKWVLRVERFIEHPLVELQPAQFAVDKMVRREPSRTVSNSFQNSFEV